MTSRIINVALTAAIVTGCSRAPLTHEDSSAAPPAGSSTAVISSQQSDWKAIEKLEQDAKILAKASGCTASADCRAAPVGARGCGGPRYYLAWCSLSTDSVALFRKLDDVAAAEKAYNIKYQIVSTCEFRMPPAIEAVAGVCTAQ